MMIAVSESLDAAHRPALVSRSFYLVQLTESSTSVGTVQEIITLCSYVVNKSKFSHHGVSCYIFAADCILFLKKKPRFVSRN